MIKRSSKAPDSLHRQGLFHFHFLGALPMSANNDYCSFDFDFSHQQASSSGSTKGAIKGAFTGAAIGARFGPIGVIAGTAIGGVLGYALGDDD